MPYRKPERDPSLSAGTPTFVVQVMYRQNATWQGTIKWLDTGEEKNFRSALELIKLMDDAVSLEDPEGWTRETEK